MLFIALHTIGFMAQIAGACFFASAALNWRWKGKRLNLRSTTLTAAALMSMALAAYIHGGAP
jgi:hypothetical protein